MIAAPEPEELRGFDALRAVLGAPGAAPLLFARTVGSLPVGMVPLGIILLLRGAGRSYGVAGLTDGSYAIGFALMAPSFGRLIDRIGMARVLVPLALAFSSVLVALALSGSSGAPASVDVALALVSGACMPPLGACMRTLWPTLISSDALRPAAYAIDATLQEVAFVLGPPLVALAVALASPRVALLIAAGLGAAGAGVFALRARARHAPTLAAEGALRSASVRRLLAMTALLGGTFGAVEVTMPAFCERHGARPAAGLILAALALGSATGGVAFGGRAPSAPAALRLLVALSAYAALLAALLAAPSIVVMVVLVFVGGLPIAPVFAGTYLLLDRFAVAGALTETFAWNTTAIFAGASLGTAAGGALISAGGWRSSLALAIGLAILCVLLVSGYARGGQLDGPPGAMRSPPGQPIRSAA